MALELLRKEFPDLIHEELPSYKVTYAEKGKNFKMKILWDSPNMLKAIRMEKKATQRLVAKHNLKGIISDNRLGVRSKKVPSIFITHQLNVLSGNTTWFSSKIHQKIISKYSVCWVPDMKGDDNLTGKLGHMKKVFFPTEYIGVLSRFKKKEDEIKYDLMVLLSGPEPQRTMLENRILLQLEGYSGKVLFVKGRVEDTQKRECFSFENCEIEMFNFMKSNELQTALNGSEMVLSRSGYTTVMDLTKLGKKCFFIPTPGQYEQEYLAERFDKKGFVPYSKQEKFSIKDLEKVKEYKGLTQFKNKVDYVRLFKIFN